ncbi:hypothetical protein diail_8450 [Diaporthe ilicicola]|nr:hypothetical protein diail_8450 [Diaporthe ilicicola]
MRALAGLDPIVRIRLVERREFVDFAESDTHGEHDAVFPRGAHGLLPGGLELGKYTWPWTWVHHTSSGHDMRAMGIAKVRGPGGQTLEAPFGARMPAQAENVEVGVCSMICLAKLMQTSATAAW